VADAVRSGEVALHALPPDEATVDTQFIRRRDGYVTSALSAFMDMARARSSLTMQAAAE
jgi:hypothetical protein